MQSRIPAARLFLAFGLGVLLTLLPASMKAQQGAPRGEWPVYGGDAGSTKFSPLDQIDEGNACRWPARPSRWPPKFSASVSLAT